MRALLTILGIDVMFAGAHHASMKMQREEGPKASIEIGRKAFGPQSGSEKAIFEVDVMFAGAHHASMKQ